MKKKFKNWIDTFIEEKDLPMNETITINNNGTLHIMSYQTVFNELQRVVFTIYGKK